MINFGLVYHCFSNIMLAWFQARTSSHPDLSPATTSYHTILSRRWNPSTPSIIKPQFFLETTIPGYPNDSEQTLFESPTHQVSRASELYFSWAHDVMTHQVGSKSDMNSVNIPALMWPSAVSMGWLINPNCSSYVPLKPALLVKNLDLFQILRNKKTHLP